MHYNCLLSFFYIKPQLLPVIPDIGRIVFYPSSTSNHNCLIEEVQEREIVFYPSSTSNHNHTMWTRTSQVLSFILLLHQTTTTGCHRCMVRELSFILLLHQTTTIQLSPRHNNYCLLSFFYIKPQHSRRPQFQQGIVFYPSSTSNHNFLMVPPRSVSIVFYPSSTSNHNSDRT